MKISIVVSVKPSDGYWPKRAQETTIDVPDNCRGLIPIGNIAAALAEAAVKDYVTDLKGTETSPEPA